MKEFLVCIDSDGSVFDTMDIKHRECFCPAYIEFFGLQAVSRYAREVWEFSNLYSSARGVNRLLALPICMDLLAERSEVKARGFVPPRLPALRAYIGQGRPLNHAGLQAWLDEHPEDEDIRTALAWSREVNERVGRMVHGVPPFPHVRECLEQISRNADIVVVSVTQQLALEREWGEHGLIHLVNGVKGQESGSKKEIIASLRDNYAPGHVLMIGDAPGDHEATAVNGALFYPIRPHEETESWREFGACMEAFLAGTYAGDMEADYLRRFERLLPDKPAWVKE